MTSKARQDEASRDLDEIDEGGEAWSRQVFRALLAPDELERHMAQLALELPPDGEATSIGGVGYTQLDEGEPWNPSRFAGHLFFFATLFKVAYFALHAISRLRGAPKAPPRSRPLRVLRMVSLISQGGVAKVCLQSILPLAKDQVELHLMVFGEKKGWAPELARRPDFNVIQRKMLLWPGSYNFKLFKNVWKLARLMMKLRPDLIHLHEPQFSPVARMAAILAGNIPLCVHLHNDYNERRRSIKNDVLALTRHALRNSRLIACSQTILEAGRLWLEPTRYPIALIEDGSDDVVDFQPHDDLPERLVAAANGRKIVAMMAHIVPHKRIEDFMSGCRILLDEGQEIFVLLMAYGRKRAGRQLRKRFNRIFEPHEGEFLYCVQSPPRLLKHVAIGVSTSVLEGLGLNVLEYQVEGVPVVCTDLKPHREMVTHGESGLLFPGYNIPEYLRAMRRLLADEQYAREIGEGGRKAAAARRWSNTAANTVQYYRSILNGQ